MDNLHKSDEELVAVILSGDESAFQCLVERHSASIYRIAFSITGGHADAEDVTQETFLRVYKHLNGFNPEKASFKTWLLTIARNQSINIFSSVKRKATRFFSDFDSNDAGSESFLSSLASPNDDAEQAYSKQVEFQKVNAAIGKLPERQRTALLLKAQEELSYEQIAVVMGATASSVESLIFRARRKLLDILN